MTALESTSRRRWGDRYDGRLLRSLDPFYLITPYIMRTRIDAQVYFEDSIDLGPAEAWMQAQREQGHKLGLLHLFVAALVRTWSQKPRLNRFVAGQKIYARNQLLVSLVVKKRMDEDSPETVVKLGFKPTDTIHDVAAVLDAAVAGNKSTEATNETDRTARIFMLCPGLVLRFLMSTLRFLDYHGLLPRALHRASPFHTSVFVTNLASLGIRPVYHHLYDFGTTSIFLAFGARQQERILDDQGKVVVRTSVDIKVVTDERICDGYYYASAFKYLMALFQHPEQLERPPASVVEDVA